MIDNRLREAFRFHARTNGQIGRHAIVALRSAKAEQTARDLNLRVDWEHEEERYEDVFGRDPHDDTQRRIDDGELLCLWGCVRAPDGEVLDSLGMVTVTGWADPYLRVVGADLLENAVATLRARLAGV